jgi:SAM-dependent methyltransferase
VPSFRYDRPPAGETAFDFGEPYYREYRRCGLCGHFFSCHEMDLSALYSSAYIEATYGTQMRAAYDRIMSLPSEASDNMGRMARVLAFAERHPPVRGRQPRLLDIGSGLAVFPARMREAGWDCTALDPDPRAAEHAQSLGLATATGDFLTMDLAALDRFDFVTFNKVIEHVEAPVVMLHRTSGVLDPGGLVYVEVPDGDAASSQGPGREEFFVEHHHVFSPASLALTAKRAGLSTVIIERLREPSGKFTICAFLGSDQG